jgi:hypothetical protein
MVVSGQLHSSRFTPGGRSPSSHQIRCWVSCTVGLEAVDKRKICWTLSVIESRFVIRPASIPSLCWVRHVKFLLFVGRIRGDKLEEMVSNVLKETGECRLKRILTMVYVVQNSHNFSGFFPSSGIPKNMTFRKLDLFPSSISSDWD